MNFVNPDGLSLHFLRFAVIIFGTIFALILGRYRAEWKSRKTLISWIWTIVAVNIVTMDRQLAVTLTAQLFIGGALVLNVINFVGDRIETIKFKDFSASLHVEGQYEENHSNNIPVRRGMIPDKWKPVDTRPDRSQVDTPVYDSSVPELHEQIGE